MSSSPSMTIPRPARRRAPRSNSSRLEYAGAVGGEREGAGFLRRLDVVRGIAEVHTIGERADWRAGRLRASSLRDGDEFRAVDVVRSESSESRRGEEVADAESSHLRPRDGFEVSRDEWPPRNRRARRVFRGGSGRPGGSRVPPRRPSRWRRRTRPSTRTRRASWTRWHPPPPWKRRTSAATSWSVEPWCLMTSMWVSMPWCSRMACANAFLWNLFASVPTARMRVPSTSNVRSVLSLREEDDMANDATGRDAEANLGECETGVGRATVPSARAAGMRVVTSRGRSEWSTALTWCVDGFRSSPEPQANSQTEI